MLRRCSNKYKREHLKAASISGYQIYPVLSTTEMLVPVVQVCLTTLVNTVVNILIIHILSDYMQNIINNFKMKNNYYYFYYNYVMADWWCRTSSVAPKKLEQTIICKSQLEKSCVTLRGFILSAISKGNTYNAPSEIPTNPSCAFYMSLTMCQAYGAKSGLKEPKLPTALTPLEVQKPVKIVLICPLQSTKMKAGE